MYTGDQPAIQQTRAIKQFYKQQLDDMMQERNKQKQAENSKQIQQRRLYNERLQQLQQMDKQKDQSYKNYYKMLMVNQQQRTDHYISPFNSRQAMKADHVKYAVQEQQLRQQQTMVEKKRREDWIKDDYKRGLRQQIQVKKQRQDIMKNRRAQEKEYYQKTSISPRQLEEMENVKRKETEMKYKEDLDKLITEKEITHLRTIRQDSKAFYPSVLDANHNPLYNPVPYTIQNPYILREMRRSMSPMNISRTIDASQPTPFVAPVHQSNPPAGISSSYFAGIGTNNLSSIG